MIKKLFSNFRSRFDKINTFLVCSNKKRMTQNEHLIIACQNLIETIGVR